MKKTLAIVLSKDATEFQAPLYDVETVAVLTDTHPQLVLHYVDMGLLEPVETDSGELLFTDSDIAQLRRIKRIRRDLGVNINGIAVMLHLLDTIEELRREIQRLRSKLGIFPENTFMG